MAKFSDFIEAMTNSMAGRGIGTAIDEAGLMGSGMLEEMLPSRSLPDSQRIDSPPARKYEGQNAVSAGPYEDPELGEEYNNQKLEDLMGILGLPVRALQRAGLTYSGSNPSQTRQAMQSKRAFSDSPSTGMQRVSAGVSDEEERKANTKLSELMAANQQKRAEVEQRQQSELIQRLSLLTSQSKANASDVFVSKGDEMLSNPSTRPSRGSFSKSNRSVVDQGAINDMVKQGMSAEKAEAIVSSRGASSARDYMADAAAAPAMSPLDIIKAVAETKDGALIKELLQRFNLLPTKTK